MEKYNVKIRSFANDEKQIRVYSSPIYRTANDKPKVELPIYQENPFTGELVACTGVKNYDGRLLEYDECVASWKKEKDETEEANEKSIYNSIVRTKKVINDYARSNSWDWFVTFTFDKEMVTSRYDREDLSKKIRQWLNNQRKRYAPDLKYIIVHEYHKDGASHFHGLFSDCGNMNFTYWKTKEGLEIYNISGFNYGFTTASRVQDSGRSANYILKYVTKELCSNVKGKNRYFASNNLYKPEEEILFLEDWEILDYRKKLAETMTYYKNLESEYLSVEYFEMKG